jgi:hypothetical protein
VSAKLSTRTLGRTLLARQHLLERTDAPALDVVSHLVGMQAQVPRDPYVALWSRIAGFQPSELEALLLDRSVIRMVAMRGTVHLLTADDAALRNLFQRVLDQEMARHSVHKDRLAGLDLGPVTAFAEVQLATPNTLPQLKAALAERFPDLDPAALALACRNTVPLVQVPPRGLWSRSGQVTYATAAAWLGRDIDPAPSREAALRRYLAAFGPATVADMATWSRLTGLREVVEAMRPTLRTWTDEDGRELFDVPDGRIADADAPAPVRFLPEYDNVLLSHADRRRVIPEPLPGLYDIDTMGIGSVLVDGRVQATWRLARPKGEPATVTVLHRAELPKRHRAAVRSEARRALPILSQGAPEARVVLVEEDGRGARSVFR